MTGGISYVLEIFTISCDTCNCWMCRDRAGREVGSNCGKPPSCGRRRSASPCPRPRPPCRDGLVLQCSNTNSTPRASSASCFWSARRCPVRNRGEGNGISRIRASCSGREREEREETYEGSVVVVVFVSSVSRQDP